MNPMTVCGSRLRKVVADAEPTRDQKDGSRRSLETFELISIGGMKKVSREMESFTEDEAVSADEESGEKDELQKPDPLLATKTLQTRMKRMMTVALDFALIDHSIRRFIISHKMEHI